MSKGGAELCNGALSAAGGGKRHDAKLLAAGQGDCILKWTIISGSGPDARLLCDYGFAGAWHGIERQSRAFSRCREGIRASVKTFQAIFHCSVRECNRPGGWPAVKSLISSRKT